MNSLKTHAAVPFVGLMVVMGVAVSGCGGDGGDAVSASPVTKPQFLKRGNAICQNALERKELRLQAATAARPRNYKATQKAAELVAASAVLPVYAEAISRLGEMIPPSRDEKEV